MAKGNKKAKRRPLNKTRQNKRIMKTLMGGGPGQDHEFHASLPFGSRPIMRLFYGNIIGYLGKTNTGTTIDQQRQAIIDMLNGLLLDAPQHLGIWKRRLFSTKRVPIVHVWLHGHSSIQSNHRMNSYGNDLNPIKQQKKPYEKRKFKNTSGAWSQRRILLCSLSSQEAPELDSQTDMLFYNKNGDPLLVCRMHFDLKPKTKSKLLFHNQFATYYSVLPAIEDIATMNKFIIPRNINATIKDKIIEYDFLRDQFNGERVTYEGFTDLKNNGVHKGKNGETSPKYKAVVNYQLFKDSPLNELYVFPFSIEVPEDVDAVSYFNQKYNLKFGVG